MRYYLSMVALALLMGGVYLVLAIHPAPPAMAVIGLFGAYGLLGDVPGWPA